MEVEQIYQRLWVKGFPIGFAEGRAEFDNFWNSPYSELPEHRQYTAVQFCCLLTEMSHVPSVGDCDGIEDYNEVCQGSLRDAKIANLHKLYDDNASLEQIFG